MVVGEHQPHGRCLGREVWKAGTPFVWPTRSLLSFSRSYLFPNVQYPTWDYLGVHYTGSPPPTFGKCDSWARSYKKGKYPPPRDMGCLVHSYTWCSKPGATLGQQGRSPEDTEDMLRLSSAHLCIWQCSQRLFFVHSLPWNNPEKGILRKRALT